MPPSGGEPIESTNCSPAVSRSFLFSLGQNGGMTETLVLLHVSRAGRIGEQKKSMKFEKMGIFSPHLQAVKQIYHPVSGSYRVCHLAAFPQIIF